MDSMTRHVRADVLKNGSYLSTSELISLDGVLLEEELLKINEVYPKESNHYLLMM